jgi:hypothetical protein
MGEHAQYRALVRTAFGLCLAGAILAGPVQAACRQVLVIGMDVSASVDDIDYRLQVEGMAAALEAPDVRDLILMQPEAPLQIAVFEWSGSPGFPVLVVAPTAVTDAAALDGIVAAIRAPRQREMAASTAIGSAINSGLELIADAGSCWRKTLDLSGDGKSNTGPLPQSVAVPPEVTVNGLVIGAGTRPGDDRLMDIKELSTYYQSNVIRGPGAFVETALGFEDFESAMTRKLIRELQGAPVGLGPLSGPLTRLALYDQ